MKLKSALMLVAVLLGLPGATLVAATGPGGEKPVVAIIGTGDMGDSLGPRFAELGYPVRPAPVRA